MLGVIEVVVFPRDYEKYKKNIEMDQRVFIKGKANVEEDKPAKLVCQSIQLFDDIPMEIWVKFKDKEEFLSQEKELYDIIGPFDGNDQVVIYCEKDKAVKRLSRNQSVTWNEEVKNVLYKKYQE